MNEQPSSPDVVASIGWKCDSCGMSGTLNVARKLDTPALVERLKALHAQESPDCRRAFRGPTELAPLRIELDAVVNDPLLPTAVPQVVEVVRRSSHRAGRFSSLLGAMVGAVALAAVPQRAPDHIEKPAARQPDPEATENPYSREARAAAREEHRARNAQSRVDAAKAKRQQKADRRRGQR